MILCIFCNKPHYDIGLRIFYMYIRIIYTFVLLLAVIAMYLLIIQLIFHVNSDEDLTASTKMNGNFYYLNSLFPILTNTN